MILDELYALLVQRRENPKQGSYVNSLLAAGKDVILKKIGEESIEVIIASKAGSREELIRELADLWFHCLVLGAAEGVSHSDILQELKTRFEKGRRDRDD